MMYVFDLLVENISVITHQHLAILVMIMVNCTEELVQEVDTSEGRLVPEGHCERPPILDALDSMRCSSWDRSTTLFHTLTTVKGLLHLVPPRTPRSRGYGVLYT